MPSALTVFSLAYLLLPTLIQPVASFNSLHTLPKKQDSSSSGITWTEITDAISVDLSCTLTCAPLLADVVECTAAALVADVTCICDASNTADLQTCLMCILNGVSADTGGNATDTSAAQDAFAFENEWNSLCGNTASTTLAVSPTSSVPETTSTLQEVVTTTSSVETISMVGDPVSTVAPATTSSSSSSTTTTSSSTSSTTSSLDSSSTPSHTSSSPTSAPKSSSKSSSSSGESQSTTTTTTGAAGLMKLSGAGVALTGGLLALSFLA